MAKNDKLIDNILSHGWIYDEEDKLYYSPEYNEMSSSCTDYIFSADYNHKYTLIYDSKKSIINVFDGNINKDIGIIYVTNTDDFAITNDMLMFYSKDKNSLNFKS